MPGRKQIETWMRSALALWAEAGQCPATGAFFESLDRNGRPLVAQDRRVRVQFRQIYVYSHAASLGLDPLGVNRARRGFDYVLAHAWAVDGRPGWAHVLNAEGEAVDPRRDAYDHAFALFGLAWYYRVSLDPRARGMIDQTLAALEELLQAPNGGFVESDRGCWPRRQNPHMHAFEAAMALFEATGEHRFLARAGEQYALFSTHFYDPSQALLFEYFDTDWRRLGAQEAQRVEPGHMAEWVWLLRDYQRLTGKPLDAQADPLFAKLQQVGFEPTGQFLVDALNAEGRVVSPTRRLWPQTELLKAALAQYRASGRDAHRRLAERTLHAIFEGYLCKRVPGLWRDKFDERGALCAEVAPASTFYHLFNAFAAAGEILYGGRARDRDRGRATPALRRAPAPLGAALSA
ncbi:MAG: AGE family epimerase/isomerase [Pseudomonadota bacterium]